MTMKLLLGDVTEMIRESAGRLFSGADGAQALRHHRDAHDMSALARGDWDGMVALGLPAMLISERFGGTGLGYRESIQVSEMMGRSLTTGPFLSTAVMAASAIERGDNDRLKNEILPKIAAGKSIVAIACEERPRHNPLIIETRALRRDDVYRISGRKIAVIDGNIADTYLVAARDVESPDRLLLLAVSAQAPGISTTVRTGLDSHPLVALEFDEVPANLDDRICIPERAPELLDHIYDAGRVHLAAEMLGLAQESFDRTIEYLKTRVQFGRLIGEFQALQHRAAILFGEIEIARSVVLKAATLYDESDDRFASCASLAKTKAGDVARHVTSEAVHLHGGLGMTDDFDLGFYLKRARSASERLGDTAFHKERYAILQGL